jgi:predicted glycogen debranching enzyme
VVAAGRQRGLSHARREMKRLLDKLVRRVAIPREKDQGAQFLLDTEWLVTNGLGGYASGSLAGTITRRYHGVLVAALPNPLGRTVMLNHVAERLVLADGTGVFLSGEERPSGPLDPEIATRIRDVRLEAGLPVWEYEWRGVRIEKRVLMPHQQNTVHVSYRVLGGTTGATLELHPAVHFRGYEEPVNTTRNSPASTRYAMATSGGVHTLSVKDDVPPLRLMVVGARSELVANERVMSQFVYPVEESRGYEFRGSLWAPGLFRVELQANQTVTLVASTEREEVMTALAPADVVYCELERRRRLLAAAAPGTQDEIGAQLVLAADQFIITPAGRTVDATRAAAMGNEIRTVIAGYHWFTDWGRDTMISLEGLSLVTGRTREANFILRTFAHYVRDGLIPNMFPDGSNEGLYHTADATLWFFHAAERYLQRTGDEETLMQLLPVFSDIVQHHLHGTRFGIGVDTKDGLLRQGADGYQLTWMDAKVEGWVVTPRRGKAVELNALWYNALRLLEQWLRDIRGDAAAKPIGAEADRVYESFNRRFWIEGAGYLYDVIDGEKGDSAECRPNQILAISLAHPVLDKARWASVIGVVQQRLLTPVGLRSLAPGEPDYKSRYFGDLRARDAAYHQGTVWGWLIGPWIDAWLKCHPSDRAGARRFLEGLVAALDEFGLGTIGEIFDADPPYTPRGCIAQAWSVAEVLRGWTITAADASPV